VPQIEDPEFYPARRLDVLPRPIGDVALRYPEVAADQEVSGRVVLLILIDELGMVVEASVISADPPGVFEEAALESFRNVMFTPAQRHGRAVKSRLPVEVNFDAKVGSLKQ
jgi:protein TonB